MKRVLCAVFSLLLAASLCACGSKEAASAASPKKQPAPAASAAAPTPAPTQKPLPSPAPTPQSEPAEKAVDVDLTALSSTMVYSEVYNMLYENTADYVGKTVKMKGAFGVAQVVVNGEVPSEPAAYACVIADATACCTQGIEFVLRGEHRYPQDYPPLGEEITVIGTFETYESDGIPGVRLAEAELQ